MKSIVTLFSFNRSMNFGRKRSYITYTYEISAFHKGSDDGKYVKESGSCNMLETCNISTMQELIHEESSCVYNCPISRREVYMLIDSTCNN